jgi:hypothetical protein
VRRNDACAGHHAAHVAGGHQEQFVAREADHFGLDLLAFRGIDQAPSAHRRFAAHRLERHADHAVQGALDDDVGGSGHALARLHQHLRPLLRALPWRGGHPRAPSV